MSSLRQGKHSKAIHGGANPEAHHGAVSVPIYQSSIFSFPSAEEGSSRFAGMSDSPIYSRLGNPTVKALEECVADLEGGSGAVATATGMAAVTTVLLTLLKQGDHVVCSYPLNGPTGVMLQQRFSRFGVTSAFVAASNTAALKAAVGAGTRLVYVGSPTNPTVDLVDLPSAADRAHVAGALLAVDNTFAGPHLQRPLDLGADIVIHSMTSVMSGHADVLAGAVVAKDSAILDQLRATATVHGLTMDSHQAWLVLRGIRTLGMRVERAQASAGKLAEWLEHRPEVEWVRYPGLPSHPQYKLAQRQMDGPGTVIAFELKGGMEAGQRLVNAVKLITLAVSMGGVQSLIEHPASLMRRSVSSEELLRQGITGGLVRLAVGCEDVEDLQADLEQAFGALRAKKSSGARS